MTYTMSGTYSTSVMLGTLSDNPTTITATGLLNDGLTVNYQGLTVVNAGTVTGTGTGTDDRDGIVLHSAGSVTNQSGGSISGYDGIYGQNVAVTVVNAGSIAGAPTSRYATGVFLNGGGSVTNQSGGSISGYDGIWGYKAAATVVNAGSIAGGFHGIYLLAGGSVSNQSGGSISGLYGIRGNYVAATVANTGSVAGSFIGIYLAAGGGSVTNQSGGAISGGDDGIRGKYALTVVNGGTIEGGNDAVRFAAGYANRLIADPGAVFYGTVNGGNTIGAAQVSTLELASAGSAGTLAGLGTQFVDFAQITVDAGAQWTLAGTNTLDAGVALIDAGTLANAGTLDGTLTLAAWEVLSNASTGTITALGGTAVDGAAGGAATVVNTGVIAGSDGSSGRGIDLAGGGSVTNQSGGSISGYDGIYGQNVAVTVVNAGSIAGAPTSRYATGVFLNAGGSVTNQSGGSVSGYDGIWGYKAAATVVNAGSIAGGFHGIYLLAGGSVTNQSGGSISGLYGIRGNYVAATVVNTGSVAGSFIGIYLDAGGGSVTNQGGGAISGGDDGIRGKYALTVVNGGTIEGGNHAVQFAAGYANRLVIDPGAVFTGAVYGGGGVLELASVGGAGTLSGFGASITGFGSLQFDSGAAWTVSGDDSDSGLGTIAITGFADNDTIDLTGFVAVGDTFAINTQVLTLTDADGVQATLHMDGTFAADAFRISSDGNDGTDVVVCFAAGTLIDTPTGEVRVEKLRVGERVMTLHNGPRPVKWIGKGNVLATRGRRTAATPVIVRKGALADNVPNRDLRVTKAHALYVDDVLIPVEFLVNHRTILWDDRAQEVEIYHVELDSHDVLIANGAPAESYRDDGNRWLFRNANSGWHLPPQDPCAPVLTGGPVVDAAWRRLLDRAGPRCLPPLTEDPDLHLVIDGVRVDPEYRRGSLYGFRLPSSPASVVIASREAVPAEFGIARDPRSLGVALRRVAIRQGGKFMLLEADDDRLTVGFHVYEADGRLRWTNGYAELPAAAFARFDEGAEVMLHLGGATRYPDEKASPARAAA